ncbi:MAG TPA: iron ABC transporter permease [Syntrophales bacterium]|nr:iron ABC transporter permease [Syntrophales bacterium]
MTAYRVLGISLLLALVFLAVVIVSLLSGAVSIPFADALRGIFLGWMPGESPLTAAQRDIVFSIRLPRALFAGIVGASLAVAGAVFQALLRNPLADPYVLGVSGGSAVGAMLGIVAGAASLSVGVPLFAFAGGVLTILPLVGIARKGSDLRSETLLLSGVIVNAFLSAVILFLLSVASRAELRNAMFWLMGDLSAAGLREAAAGGLVFAAGFVVLYADARPLNLVAMGEETARQLGVELEGLKLRMLLAASLVTAAAVSVSGIIGFVGLMVPHMMRLVFGADHRLHLPACALFGASFLAAADTLARTAVAPSELPVGVVTALCGAPYFIYLLRRRDL